MKRSLSATELRHALDYDSKTGVFTHTQACKRPDLRGTRAGSINEKGYRRIFLSGGAHQEHRLAWLHVHGSWPKAELDHINRDKSDNRIANLREATRSGNVANIGPRSDCKTGLRGVSFRNGRYVAHAAKGGRQLQRRGFLTAEEAHQVYLQFAKELHGDFAFNGGGQWPGA